MTNIRLHYLPSSILDVVYYATSCEKITFSFLSFFHQEVVALNVDKGIIIHKNFSHDTFKNILINV
jgi:hypothetical protein